jgi:hypothetical protein
LKFLIDKIDQPEEALALETALNFYNVAFRLDVNDVNSIKNLPRLGHYQFIQIYIIGFLKLMVQILEILKDVLKISLNQEFG